MRLLHHFIEALDIQDEVESTGQQIAVSESQLAQAKSKGGRRC
jgi:hypothetical protein